MERSHFKERFLPLHPKLYRIAYSLLGSQVNAEDVVQETYIKLWSKRFELNNLDSPEAFAVRVLKNRCLDHLKSPKLSGKGNQELDKSTAIELTTSMDRRLEARDEITHIRSIINTLPAKQRTVILLRAVDDCEIDEIESITGLSQTNIRTLLHRARAYIKDKMRHDGFKN